MAKQQFRDPRGTHIRVYQNLLNSPAYRVLGYSAKALFYDLRAKLTGTNNGILSASLAVMKHGGWTAPATLSNALYELRVMGFIAVTKMGGLREGSRMPTLYRFTDLPMIDHPREKIAAMKITDDYLAFKSVHDAEVALSAGVGVLRAEGKAKQKKNNASKGKKSPVQKMPVINTKSVLKNDFSSTDFEQGSVVINTDFEQGNLEEETVDYGADQGF